VARREPTSATARGAFKRWTKGDDNSPVSDGDIAVNELLHARLGELTPGVGWLSEESKDHLPDRAAPTSWIVDPIDGTRAYISGRADWTISVALVEQWRPFLTQQLGGLGLEVTPSAANFVLVNFPKVAGKTAPEAEEFLASKGYLVRAVGNYGLPDAIRITIGLEEHNRAVVELLTEFMGR